MCWPDIISPLQYRMARPAPTPSALVSGSWRIYAMAGYVVIFVTFVVLGGAAALVSLASAVVAPGVITVASNRKPLQSLEGGIIAQELVNEGDVVKQGQVLFRLSGVQAESDAQMLRSGLVGDMALEARLTAEQIRLASITWPPALLKMQAQMRIDQVLEDQAAQFSDRRLSQLGQIDILNNRISQMRLEIAGMAIERTSTTTQLKLIRVELAGLMTLLQQKLIQTVRVMSLQREQARLEGTLGQLMTSEAKVGQQIAEVTLQITQLRTHFQEEVATSLFETRKRIVDEQQKLLVAEDVLRRVEIVAPAAGSVQGLHVGGVGQVIRPGELLLEIVPSKRELQVNVQFQPNDAADLKPGQQVEIRFGAFPARATPLVSGRLDSVSSDRLIDDTTRQPYFLGIVKLDASSVSTERLSELRAGMPAEVVVPTAERSLLSYLIDPLSNALRKTFIEK